MEDHIGRIGQDGIAGHGDAQFLAHRAASAITANQILGMDLFGLTGLDVADRRLDAIGILGEVDQFRVIAQISQ